MVNFLAASMIVRPTDMLQAWSAQRGAYPQTSKWPVRTADPSVEKLGTRPGSGTDREKPQAADQADYANPIDPSADWRCEN